MSKSDLPVGRLAHRFNLLANQVALKRWDPKHASVGRVKSAIIVILTFTGVALLWPTQAQPPTDELQFPYPAQAQMVLMLSGLDRLQERIDKLADTMAVRQRERWRQNLSKQLESLLKGRDASVLRRDARLYFVIHDLGEDLSNPHWSLLLPVRSHRDFRLSFLTLEERQSRTKEGKGIEAFRCTLLNDEPQTVYLVDLPDYVAVCSERVVAEVYAGEYTRGSTRVLGPRLTEAFLRSDVAFYLNLEGLVQRYANELRALKGLLDFALRRAGQEIPGLSEAEAELIKKMLLGLFQALEDSQAAVLTLNLEPGGLDLHLQIRFGENTASSKVLASETGLAAAEIGQLPAGMPYYYAFAAQGQIGALMLQDRTRFQAADKDAPGQRLLQLHLDDLRQADLQSWRGCLRFPLSGLEVLRYRDADKALRAWVKLYKVLGAGAHIPGARLKMAPGVRENAVQHRGFSFTEVRLHHDDEHWLEDAPEAQKEVIRPFIHQLYPERVTLWIGLIEKNKRREIVHLWGRDWDSVSPWLDSYLDGKHTLSSRPEFSSLRPLWGEHSNGFIVDLQPLIPAINELFRMIANVEEELPVSRIKLKQLSSPAPLLWSYMCQEEIFSMRVHFSAQAFGVLLQLLEQASKEFD